MIDRIFRPTRRRAMGMFGAAFILPQSVHSDTLVGISGSAFGTTWRAVGPPRQDLERLRPEIEALFSAIDRQMSPWRADSQISQFNAMRAGWLAQDPEMIHVTAAALELANASGGAFDPTVGPLVAQWGFGPIEGSTLPDWRAISLRTDGIGKARDDLTLDLCGIAKGRALDRAVDLARNAGLNNLLFDLGGEFKALGQHPSGRPWHVAVQHPLTNQPAPATLRLSDDWAVATSGLQSQSYELAQHVYGHIIDTKTRAPADSGLLSVTVVAKDAMTADGWATALFAAGLTDGQTLANDLGMSALFLVRDGTGVLPVKTGAIEMMFL